MDQNNMPSLEKKITPDNIANKKSAPESLEKILIGSETTKEIILNEFQAGTVHTEQSPPAANITVSPQEDPVRPIISPDPISPELEQDHSLSAEDRETIEDTWIKKAKDILNINKNLPYNLEEAHEDLQIEYLKKRFGKNVKKSED